MLEHRLLSGTLESVKLQVLLAINGFRRRRINLVEQKLNNECDAIPDNVAISDVSRQFLADTCEGVKKGIFVRSFTTER